MRQTRRTEAFGSSDLNIVRVHRLPCGIIGNQLHVDPIHALRLPDMVPTSSTFIRPSLIAECTAQQSVLPLARETFVCDPCPPTLSRRRDAESAAAWAAAGSRRQPLSELPLLPRLRAAGGTWRGRTGCTCTVKAQRCTRCAREDKNLLGGVISAHDANCCGCRREHSAHINQKRTLTGVQ